MTITIEFAKPSIGCIVRVDKAHLLDDDVIEAVRSSLEERGVIVLLGTFFWHVDGATMDMSFPKATVLSARRLAAQGGATEFANLYAAYERLPEDEKREIENLWVIHTVEAAVRPVHGRLSQERIERYRKLAPAMEHPLVWQHENGRNSLLIGTHAEGVVGMPGAHARALLTRLQQWAAQPELVYRHNWQQGDLVIWNNQSVMHRVLPYTDQRRVMHRTVIGGRERPGHRARRGRCDPACRPVPGAPHQTVARDRHATSRG